MFISYHTENCFSVKYYSFARIHQKQRGERERKCSICLLRGSSSLKFRFVRSLAWRWRFHDAILWCKIITNNQQRQDKWVDIQLKAFQMKGDWAIIRKSLFSEVIYFAERMETSKVKIRIIIIIYFELCVFFCSKMNIFEKWMCIICLVLFINSTSININKDSFTKFFTISDKTKRLSNFIFRFRVIYFCWIFPSVKRISDFSFVCNLFVV